MVGAASTVAYILLYLLLRDFLPAQAANAIGLLVTAVANTGVNRRLTFGIRGRAHAARDQVRGLIAFGIGLALTSGALGALHAASARPSRAAEVLVLILANLVGHGGPVRAVPKLGVPQRPGRVVGPARRVPRPSRATQDFTDPARPGRAYPNRS